MATMGKGIVKKMMFTSQSQSRSMNGVDLNTEDISIALEYTGSPVNNSMLLKVMPVDADSLPTANIFSIDASVSPSHAAAIFYNLSLPVVQPILKTKIHHLLIPDSVSTFPFTDDAEIVDFKDHLDTSGTIGFSDTTSHGYGDRDFSQSSDTPLPLSLDCNHNHNHNHNHFGGIFCQEEELSDDEHLERNRKGIGNNKLPVSVTFRDHDESLEESAYSYDGHGKQIQRPMPVAVPVPEKPPKKGMCYHCHTGNRLTEKQACLVCDAKYCRRCIRKAMGSMPEGRKCLTCIGFPVQDSKRRKMLGKSSHILRAAFKFKEEEVKQIMEAELSCAPNQLPPECIWVNGTQLTFNELMLLHNCPNPPTNLKPGSYWYDRVSGLWGKEGHKPCQIITPNLTVGDQKIKPKASNGNTNVVINNREITKVEQFVLKRAGVMCEGNPRFWLQADGTFLLEGMKKDMKYIWSKKRTKLLCALLSLPTPQYPNPRGKSNRAADGALSNNLIEKKSLCKLLLLGIDASGTSTIYKQARVLYDIPFSEEERRNIKFMIQSNLFEYLGRLLEGRELFEDEEQNLFAMNTELGPSDSIKELQDMTKYTISKKLKDFSDSLIDNMVVSSKLDMIFQDFAPGVEELWNDAAIQATYSRLHELQLPRAANYFLDKAVEITKEDYEPSDTDIMYAKGITSSNGLATMEFSFPHTQDDDCGNTNDLPDPITRYQLTRVHEKTLGQKCKWLDMFEDFGIVLFCVSLADYDEYDSGLHTNRMLQSKRLFESVISHPVFKDKNFLLILNKFDLLEEKIEQVPLTCCEWFEDFNPVFSRHQSTRRGGNNNIAPLAQQAFHYIGVKFKKVFKSLTGRKLYVCPVTGLESDSVDNAVRYAREIIRWDEDKLNYSSLLDDFSCESIDNSSYS